MFLDSAAGSPVLNSLMPECKQGLIQLVLLSPLGAQRAATVAVISEMGTPGMVLELAVTLPTVDHSACKHPLTRSASSACGLLVFPSRTVKLLRL